MENQGERNLNFLAESGKANLVLDVRNQDILGRNDLVNLGFNLLRGKGYSHELAQELSLDALYLCAESYLADRGTTVRTYYNKCLFWVCGHLLEKLRSTRNNLGEQIDIDGVDISVMPRVTSIIDAEDLLNLLPGDKQKVMGLIYEDGYTMEEAGIILGVSRARVGQIVDESKELIRKKIRFESEQTDE